METLLMALAAPVAAPLLTKGLAYILPPEWVMPTAAGIMKAAETKQGLSSRKA
jgi:hypothetical protein